MDEMGVSQLGRAVALYRKRARLSGEALAERAGAGLTRSIIANLENGRKADVTTTQLLSIALALDVSPMLLMFDLTDPYGRSTVRPAPDEVTVTTWLAAAWWAGDIPASELDTSEDATLGASAPASDTPDGGLYLLHRRSEIHDELGEAEGELRSSRDSERSARLTDAVNDLRDELRALDADLRARGFDLSKPIVRPEPRIQFRG